MNDELVNATVSNERNKQTEYEKLRNEQIRDERMAKISFTFR